MFNKRENYHSNKLSYPEVISVQHDWDDEIDLRKLLATFWRRKAVIIGTVLAVTSISVLHVAQLVPRYTAKTLVMLENQKLNLVDIKSVVSDLDASYNSTAIQNEMQLLKSPPFIGKVVDRLNYGNVSKKPVEKAKGKEATGLFNIRSYLPREWIRALTGKQDRVFTEDEMATRKREGVINRFLGKLKIKPVSGTTVLEMKFQDESPAFAALAANTVADQFIVEQFEAKFRATRHANDWLNSQLASLKGKVKESELAVEKYRKEFGLVGSKKGVTLTSQRITRLNNQLADARIAMTSAEIKYKRVSELLKTPGKISSSEAVMNSSLIYTLRLSEVELLHKISEMATVYGEKHPVMINIRAKLKEVRQKIGIEANKIAEVFRDEFMTAKARVKFLKTDLGKLERSMASNNEYEIKLRALEREAEANRTLFDAYLSRFKEISSQEGFDRPSASIISKATVPATPSYPKTNSLIGAIFFMSILMGMFFVYVLEMLDSGFRSVDHVENETGLHALGMVPSVKDLKGRSRRQIGDIVTKPNTAYSESIRSLRTALNLSNLEKPPKVFMITSSLPSEGKTTMAISIVRQAAQSGKKVIFVDCDLRNSRLRNPKKIGLVELLADENSFEEVLYVDKSGAHFITTGRHVQNPVDLLGSEHMEKLIERLAFEYDLVIVDSPPVMIVSDARVLAHMVDKTVYVAQWGKTKRDVVSSGLKTLKDSGADLAGVVLSQVDVRKHAKYNYSDSAYYSYSKYSRYYTHS